MRIRINVERKYIIIYKDYELYIYNHYNRIFFFNPEKNILNNYLYKNVSRKNIQLTVDINMNLNSDTFIKIVKFIIPLIKYNYDF